MSSWSLFPEQHDDFAPAADRPAPVVWVRRLAIIERREPGIEPVREVSFRRGLNIIATAQPRAGSRRSAGHSVGKTLLVRLIRYCLGEPHYGPTELVARVGQSLPGAWVLMEVEIDDRLWSVARPIGGDRPANSYVVEGQSWDALLSETKGLARIGTLVEAIEGAVFGDELAHLTLPHADRGIRWQDVLAWMARDQRCRYAQSHTWRHADTGSGVADLHFEDASLVMRAIMGLLGSDESALIAKHQALLREKARLKDEIAELERVTAFLGDRLRHSSDEEDLGDGALPLSAMKERFKTAVKQAKDELREIREQKIPDIEHRWQTARDRVAVARGRIDEITAERKLVEGRRKAAETGSRADLLKELGELGLACHLPECPRRIENQPAGATDPQRTELLRTLDQQIAELDQRLAEAESARSEAQRALDNGAEDWKRELDDHHERESQLERELVRYDDLLDKATELEHLGDELTQKEKRLEKQSAKSDASLEQQREMRKQHAQRHATLNRHADHVAKSLLGPDAGAEIVIEARAFRPVATTATAAGGDAIGTSALVLGLDLACLRASCEGLGLLPRLLIHDSPREADLERQIYDHLFEVAMHMEQSCAGDPNFQYIVTTTSTPPDVVRDDVHVRLTLDGQDDEDLFLRRRV